MTDEELKFYQQFYANNMMVWKDHPMTANLVGNQAYMLWWDALKPEERKALEDNIDKRLSILEKWKCRNLPSPTRRTQLSAVQLLKLSAFGPMNGAGESPEQPGGKSKSPTKL